MTKSEFKRIIDTQGNNFDFELAEKKYNMGYIPVPLGDGKYGYDKIGIYEVPKEPIEDEEDFNVKWFKTVDEMLEEYIIDGSPLGELLDKVEKMHNIPYG